MSTLIKKQYNAVFFAIDGVVRRLLPERGRAYAESHGMAPPVPVDVGDQGLIEPVVEYIIDYCAKHDALPIGIDTAPYLEGNQMTLDQYQRVMNETQRMLRQAGMRNKKGTKENVPILYCPHAPNEVVVADPTRSNGHRFDYTPNCKCRFPNAELLFRAAVQFDVRTQVNGDQIRILPPSVFIGNNDDQKQAAVMRCSMDFTWVESILNGSIYHREQIDNLHLKLAREIQKDPLKLKNKLGSMISVDTIADGV